MQKREPPSLVVVLLFASLALGALARGSPVRVLRKAQVASAREDGEQCDTRPIGFPCHRGTDSAGLTPGGNAGRRDTRDRIGDAASNPQRLLRRSHAVERCPRQGDVCRATLWPPRAHLFLLLLLGALLGNLACLALSLCLAAVLGGHGGAHPSAAAAPAAGSRRRSRRARRGACASHAAGERPRGGC